MAVQDDAIFELSPANVTMAEDGSYSDMVAGDVTFDRKYITHFSPVVRDVTDGDWSFAAETDAGATGAQVEIFASDGWYLGWVGSDPVLSSQAFLVTLAAGYAADPSGAPAVLASVQIGDPFPVVEGVAYFLSGNPMTNFSLPEAPPSWELGCTWLDSGGAPVGDPQIVRYQSAEIPASSGYRLWPLGVAPTGAEQLKVELLMIPQPYVSTGAGAVVVLQHFVFFAESASYDNPESSYWEGGELPVSSGRHVETIGGIDVISGESDEWATLDPPPTSHQYTIVAAFVTNDAATAESTPDASHPWVACYDVYDAPGGIGSRLRETVPDPSSAGDWVSLLVAIPSLILDAENDLRLVGAAMTFDDSTGVVVAKFFDLNHGTVLEVNYPVGSDSDRDGTVYLGYGGKGWDYSTGPQPVLPGCFSGKAGIKQVAVWDRVLDDAEVVEALAYVSGLTAHSVTFGRSAHSGGSPITRYIFSVYDGVAVRETPYELPDLVGDPISIPPITQAVWVQAENAVGRSYPAELDL